MLKSTRLDTVLFALFPIFIFKHFLKVLQLMFLFLQLDREMPFNNKFVSPTYCKCSIKKKQPESTDMLLSQKNLQISCTVRQGLNLNLCNES